MIDFDISNPPVPSWWLHMGNNINGDVLVITSPASFIVYSLISISRNIYVINDSHDYGCDRVKSLSVSDFKKDMFDGVIANCIEVQSELRKRILFKSIDSLTKNGSVCSIERKFHKIISLKAIKSIANEIIYKKTIKQVGLEYIDHKLHLNEFLYAIIYGDNIYESKLDSYYYTNKNTFLLKEKIKIFLSKFKFSLYLSSGYISIAGMNPAHKTMLDDLALVLRRNVELQWHNTSVRPLKVYYKCGKLLISFSSKDDRSPEYIVVLCTNNDALKQRRNEFRVINKLSEIKEISRLLPDIHGEYSLYKIPYYVIKEFKGLTVDIDNKHMPIMIESAYSILPLFLKHKKRNFIENRAVIKEKLDYYHNRILNRSSTSHDKINKLYFLASELNNNISIPLIPMHGDYKIENVVLDPDDFSVIGLIDFELSDLSGFPFLDLLYLITYNIGIQSKLGFLKVYSLILNNRVDSFYQKLIDNYMLASGFSAVEYKFVLIIYFMHHFSERYLFDVDIDNAEIIKSFDSVLNEAIILLEEA